MGAGALVGGLLGLASGIFGKVSASREADKAAEERSLGRERQRKFAEEVYNEQMRRDPSRTAANSWGLEQLFRQAREDLRNARGRQAVIGGGEKEVAAIRQANTNAVANFLGNAAVAAETSRNNAAENHLATIGKLNEEETEATASAHERKAQSLAGFADTAGSALMTLGGAFDDYRQGLKDKTPSKTK